MLQKRTPQLAGLLRESVTFQQRSLDANGDRLGPWVDMFAAPARVVHIVRTRGTGGETVLDQRLTGVQPVEVTLRLDQMTAQLDTDWRFHWLNWPLMVTAVAVDELAAVVTLIAVRTRDDYS